MLAYKKAISVNSAFIPQEIRILFTQVFNICHLCLFSRDGIKADWEDVLAIVDKMQKELRAYLNSLVVVE